MQKNIPGSGILADGVLFDEKSAIIWLAFLSSHLTNGEKLVNLSYHFLIPPPPPLG
jgi:abnormal spindle-like microcephaly-associated protein